MVIFVSGSRCAKSAEWPPTVTLWIARKQGFIEEYAVVRNRLTTLSRMKVDRSELAAGGYDGDLCITLQRVNACDKG